MINSKSEVHAYKRHDKTAKIKFIGLNDESKDDNDDVIKSRMRKVRDEIAYLQRRLDVEKESLARERMETAAVTYNYYTRTDPVSSMYQMHPHSFSQMYNPSEFDWSPYSAHQFPCYSSNHSCKIHSPPPSAEYASPDITESLRQLLDRAEDVCQSELSKVRKDINELKRSNRHAIRIHNERHSRERKDHEEISNRYKSNAADESARREKARRDKEHKRKSMYILPDERAALENLKRHERAYRKSRRKQLNDEDILKLSHDDSGNPIKSSHSLWCFEPLPDDDVKLENEFPTLNDEQE